MVIVQHYRAHVALSGCVYACVPAWAGSAAYGTRSVYTLALLYAAKIGIGRGRVTVTLRSHRHIDGDDRQKYHPLYPFRSFALASCFFPRSPSSSGCVIIASDVPLRKKSRAFYMLRRNSNQTRLHVLDFSGLLL